MKFIAILFLIQLSYATMAQTNEQQKTVKQLKAYINGIYDWNKSPFVDVGNTEQYKVRIRPAIGLAFLKPNGSYHEISIRELWYEHDDVKTTTFDGLTVSGGRRRTFRFSARHEYFKPLVKNGGPWQFGVAFGALFEADWQSFEPYLISFPRNQRGINLFPEATPHLTLRLKKINLDVSFPVKIAQISWQFQRTENPAISRDRQKENTFKVEWLPNIIEWRLGVSTSI